MGLAIAAVSVKTIKQTFSRILLIAVWYISKYPFGGAYALLSITRPILSCGVQYGPGCGEEAAALGPPGLAGHLRLSLLWLLRGIRS